MASTFRSSKFRGQKCLADVEISFKYEPLYTFHAKNNILHFLNCSSTYINSCYFQVSSSSYYFNCSQREYIIYRVEFTQKKCKTALLLYSSHTAGVLQTFVLLNVLGPVTSFYRKKFS